MMEPYSKFRPTAFDSHIALEDREHWLVLGVIQTRDSEALSRSNFECALRELGGESETVEVHRFGHWGPGWFEVILIDPEDSEAVKAGEEIEAALADYPVLDDDLFSTLEEIERVADWQSWAHRDFVRRMVEIYDLSDAAENLLDGDWDLCLSWHDEQSPDPRELNYILDKNHPWYDRDAVASLLRDLRKARG